MQLVVIAMNVQAEKSDLFLLKQNYRQYQSPFFVVLSSFIGLHTLDKESIIPTNKVKEGNMAHYCLTTSYTIKG